MSKEDPFPIFYSLNRFIDHEACISAGSVEICRALFKLDVVGKEPAARSSEQWKESWIHVDLFLFPTLLIYRMSKIAESMVSRWLFSQA